MLSEGLKSFNMGYFQHKHSSIADAGILKKCLHCGDEFEMRSGNQKYCHPQENPECESDRHFHKLYEKGKHPIQLEKLNNSKMKEETKIFLSRIIIMLEKQLSDIEQDLSSDGISERERKGIAVEKTEVLSELSKAKKCFGWLCELA